MRTISYRAALFLLFSGAVFQSPTIAQDLSRGKTIIITRGDTVINGKHFNTLTQKEKDEALKDFPSLKHNRLMIDGTGIVIERDDLNATRPRIITRGNGNNGRVFSGDGDSLIAKYFHFDDHDLAGIGKIRDSLFQRYGLNSIHDDFITKIPKVLGEDLMLTLPGRPPFGGGGSGADGDFARIAGRRNNSQSFSYNSVDKNGIATRMSFNVVEPSSEDFGKITGRVKDDNSPLEATDLALFPSFSTGKVTLTFTLETKTVIEIRLLDADLKTVYSEKPQNFSGVFSKSLELPKNGVYYLSVNQGGKWMVKKIIKQN